MDMISFFANNEVINKQFNNFLSNNINLTLDNIDSDTKYFKLKNANHREIYYHFEFNNIQDELSFNYNLDENIVIKNYFGCENIFLFDVQYRNQKFMDNILVEFEIFIKCNVNKYKVLIYHPIKGFLYWFNY